MKIIICGAGRVGTTLAKHLAGEGMSVTVIDTDAELIRHIDESYDVRGVTGHASHPRTLRKAGAQDADLLIAVTRSDEVNMVACQIAYSLFGVKRRIARLRHAGYLEQDGSGLYAAEHLPIDIIISPEIEIADSIVRLLRTPGAFDMVTMANRRITLLGIHVEQRRSPITGQRLADLSHDPRFANISIVAIARQGRSFVPGSDDQVQQGDDVYIVTKTEKIEEAMEVFGHWEQQARRVVIVGAGNIGLHLAQKIRKVSPNVNLKIVERDRKRAEEVATELGSGAVILHGEALEGVLLDDAHAGSAETVVAVTNDDEVNIFASVLAKRAGCQRTISLVNKRIYETLTPSLGIDALVNPSAITISTVLRHIRRGSISALYTLREDFGEVIEATVPEHSALIGQPLDQLGFPADMKIAAILRETDVLIPCADTRLHAGDHVVVLITYNNLHLAETLFVAETERV